MPKELIDDELWSLIEPLLPARAPRNRQYAGRKPTPDRAVLTGIVFVLSAGIAWNLLPQEMGCGWGWSKLSANFYHKRQSYKDLPNYSERSLSAAFLDTGTVLTLR
jgi:transposase